MAPDQARGEDASAWLRKAALDLTAAAHEATYPAGTLWSDVAFHAQQAAEKSFKAFLTWHDVPFRRTHSFEELGRACEAIDPSLLDLVDEAAPLTEYGWKFRYPGEASEATRAEAEAALATAGRVYGAVAERIGERARS